MSRRKSVMLIVVSLTCLLLLAGTVSALSNGSSTNPFVQIWNAIFGLQQDVEEIKTSINGLSFPAPNYDSGWIDITDKSGQLFKVTHNLNYQNNLVQITGKASENGGVHTRYLGLTNNILGWSQQYGGAENDEGSSVIQTNDGGYAVIGQTQSFGLGGRDIYLVKTDSTGQIEWSKTYGGTGHDFGRRVIQNDDGGFIIAGYTATSSNKMDMVLIKTFPDGSEQWSKTYGSTYDDYCLSMIQTSDGGYAMVGYTGVSYVDPYDIYLIKVDANGQLQWSQTYGGTGNYYGRSVVEANGGGYVIAGYINPFGPVPDNALDNGDMFLLKISADGTTVEWSQTYLEGDNNNEIGFTENFGYSVTEAADGGYAIIGQSVFYERVGFSMLAHDPIIRLVKTNSNGELQWMSGYEGTIGNSIIQTIDNGYAIAGYKTTLTGTIQDDDALILKIDSQGKIQWSKTYGETLSDAGQYIIRTDDGGYAIAGRTKSNTGTDNDVYLIKTDVEGEFGLAQTDSTANTITLYRGQDDACWNYVRVQIWKIAGP